MAHVAKWASSCAIAALVCSALLAAHLVFGLDVQEQQAESVGKVVLQQRTHFRYQNQVVTEHSLQAFVEAYYQMFESDRAGLGSLYEAQSTLTFEGQTFIGAQAIAEKLQGLPLNQSRVDLSSGCSAIYGRRRPRLGDWHDHCEYPMYPKGIVTTADESR